MGLGLLLFALQVGQPGTVTFDVRCTVVLGQLAQSEDQAARQAGATASQFFFGRLDGRVPDGQLEDVIWRETRNMRTDDRAGMLRACGSFLEGRGRRLQEIGNRISQREGAPARR